jgi:predicted transposase YbfD/YdcC
VALDGKTLRGSRKQGAPGVHLRSALAHQVGVTRAHQAVAAKPKESTAVETGRGQMVRKGRGVTREALLTQTAVAQTIGDAGGDDVMIGNANQPQRRSDIELILAAPPVGDHQETAATLDRGHGRMEQRRLTTRQALAGYGAWPGLAPVLALERSVLTKQTGEVRSETVAGVTSLTPQGAAPSRVLELVRGHGQIEHLAHWLRDVTFDEDRSQVRWGNIPQVRAALRHTPIGRLRWAGYATMAAACRLLAAQPVRALALIGIPLEN